MKMVGISVFTWSDYSVWVFKLDCFERCRGRFHSISVLTVFRPVVVKSTSKCYDTVTKKYYREAELWQRDECTSCYCGDDRKPVCTVTSCPPVYCEAPMKIEQRCCPVCPVKVEQGERGELLVWVRVRATSRVVGPSSLNDQNSA